MKKYIVLKDFADKNSISKHYKPGDELPEGFGEDRLADIVSRGLAKVEDTGAGNGNGDNTGAGNGDGNVNNTGAGNGDGNVNNTGAGNTVTDIDLTGNVADMIAQVKIFEDVEKLTQYLETEQSAEKPRVTVVKAIEDRLADIVKE
jgi:hypothetical protein